VLLPWLLRWEQPADRTTFAAGLHAGSCVGITWALRRELLAVDRHTLALVASATVPAAVAGLLAADAVEQRLGRPPQLAALLASAGALLWWADARAVRSEGAVGPREAAWAGLAQVAALVPGVSRSGATLTALRLAGVDREAAHRFTLLLSLPVTAGAAVLTLVRTPRSRLTAAVRLLAPGALTAAVAGATTVAALDPRGGAVVRRAALYRLGLAAETARQLHRRRTREGPP
jgi:undecaprenyl-diphosphatase